MRIFISGSLAYDRIMNFPGHFADHILPEKIHVLNVCFNIDGLQENFGGTAGNIAYSLAQLGEKPFIVATCGEDFDRYERWLKRNALPTDWIKKIEGVYTAGAYITTDLDDNQITAFNPGAMAFEAGLPPLDGDGSETLVLIGPGNKIDMMNFARAARDAGARFIFDPGQSLNTWRTDEIRGAVQGAHCFVSNDYELSQFLQIANWPLKSLYEAVDLVITTKGPEGAILDFAGDRVLVPAVRVANVLDPTGAGDAFRGGCLKGLALGMPWDVCCQMGVVAASFAVEHYGTQEHVMDWGKFCERYDETFGSLIC